MTDAQRKYPVIAARERGPGPGRYSLPPTIGIVGHDLTKIAGPAYTFHGHASNSMYFVDSSPGPQYYIDAKMTRFGRDGTPAFTMLGRRKDSSILKTPGPGDYSPEVAPPLNRQRQPPSYTMGSRTRYRTVDSVPAPNKYSLPSLLGSRVPIKPSSASYTLSGRTKVGSPSEDLSGTPGPGRYNSTDPSIYLPRKPAYSMLGRYNLPTDSTRKPGPGTHSPEKVTAHKPKPPAYSLGIRHSEYVTPLITDVSE
ncbi:outer dense fiber protein 3-like protein 2b [Polypterus senegalus]|nr:outer dense fiber protein 3-like protein 2b [Polypterus senegalus]